MIRILFYLSSLVCISLASLPIKAMDYHFKRYEIDEGLSNNSVNGCVQDANGFLWIGTRDGLNRFDGVTFYTFYNQASQKNSLISDWINDLVLSPKGELWVSTNKGIQRYDYQTESFFLLPFTEGANYTDIAFDHKGLLWMLSPQSLICYNEASDHFQTYNLAENDPVVSFYITSDDEFWAISKQGYIGKLDRRTQAFEYVVEEPSQTPVHIEHASTLYVSISHQIALVGTVDQGIKLVQLSDGKTQELIKPQKRQPLYARSIQPMNEDEIWIATFNGIYIYHLTTKTITHLAQEKGNYYSLSSNAIKRFCKDREGGIWICTDNGGINYLPPYLSFHYQSKIDFFLHIAHEIRTPLTLIKGPLDRMEADHSLSEQTRKYLKTIDKNANWLLDLVNQLLDFKKTEINDYPLTFTNEDAYLLLQETVDRFKDTAEQAHLQVEIHAQVDTWTACVDRTAYIKILSNLLSNAVKYAEHWICVKFAGQNEQFVIDFMNDGQPISLELKDKIFEPFYRIASSAHKPGSGLGLPFARFLAEKHGGTLACEETNDGTILFRLTLPNRQTTPEETGIEQPQAIEARQSLADPHLNPKKDCPHILIVEDHAEMAQFIAEELSYTYNITIAYNGVEALEQLREQSIQLIISDVMMPVMDGLTLLKTIRKDHQLCHIPFILLTAKCTEQTHMEGLEYGADAYFEKPFSIHLLTKQVANLLDSRNNIRDYYAHSPMVNLKLAAHTKADELFLQRVDDIIQSHIADEKLDVDMIAAKMNLSRPTLYRKINEISEMTPNEWIKITRLRKAAELILQGDLKIYEIAEAVGFNSQSYFSRTFAKQFHMSPTQYAKSNNVQLK